VEAGELRISPWSAKAQDSNDYLLFVPSFGGLFYDADGNGAGAAVQIASLTGISSLDVSNLFVFFPPGP
jgi:Ca2+-binding RTX toxin-like protein